MSKHTPGPWEASKEDNEVGVWVNAPGDRAVGFALKYPKTDGVEARTNAHLIAAAPELLEACEQMIALIRESEGVAGYHLNGELMPWRNSSLVELIETALAKVEGRR